MSELERVKVEKVVPRQPETIAAQSQIIINSIVRLGPWHGRIVDILTSDTTDEKYGRVKLVKHLPGVTEIHPLNKFKPASLTDAEWELQVMQERYQQAWQEVLCES